MMKRAYQAISMLAIAHVVVVLGGGAYLVTSGMLTRERAELIAKILRGEYPPPVDETAGGEGEEKADGPVETRIAQAQEEKEALRRLLEREVREVEDRQRLVDAAMLDVIRRHEQLEADRGAFAQQQEAIRAERMQSGFVKELELLSAAKPAARKELLRQKPDADVVKLLMEMDERQGKQVIDACKSPEELAWIARILHQIQTQNGLSSAETERSEPEAQVADNR
jgi:hypothetical protein